jgi:hypothetical protein
MALGEKNPAKKIISEASPGNLKDGIEFIDLQRGLKLCGSKKSLIARKKIRHFDTLMSQSQGMFVGRGNIQTTGMRTPALHYFSFNASVGLFHDRAGEMVLLAPEDRTRKGSDVLFLRKHATDGKHNMGYLDVREVFQVMVTP